MTHVHVDRFVQCPFSAAMEYAEQAVSGRTGLYVSPSPPFGEEVQFGASTTQDASDTARKHDALLIAWRPRARRMFPDFHGVVTVRPQRAGVSMRLTGQYEPPFGGFGKFFDAIAGRSIARSTMRHLLDGLAGEIESRYQSERRHAP